MIFIAVKYEMLFNSCELTFVFLAGKFPLKTFKFQRLKDDENTKTPRRTFRPCYAQLAIVPAVRSGAQTWLFTPNARLKCNGLNSPRSIY